MCIISAHVRSGKRWLSERRMRRLRVQPYTALTIRRATTSGANGRSSRKQPTKRGSREKSVLALQYRGNKSYSKARQGLRNRALRERKTVFVGDTFTITATVKPEDAFNRTVTWRSSDPSIATVDENGTVTAIAEGEAIITAESADGVTAECKVTVEKRRASARSCSM